MATVVREGAIVEGPGKWNLMLAIMDSGTALFTLEGIGQMIVNIDTLQREDGSSDSWNIFGKIQHPRQHDSERVEFYYHSGRRRGHYRLTTK